MTYMRYCRRQDACGPKVDEKAEAVEFSLVPLCSQLHHLANHLRSSQSLSDNN
jgi:hypothetical protein